MKRGYSMLKNKKILLCVTGGIAAYKAVDLASRLTKAGAIVKVILTKNACEFINPLTFKAITHQSVSVELFNLEVPIEHISLADWADIVVIAPATANIIGKVASGIADDLLSTTIMATSSPVLFVPAMNVKMYQNPITQANISKLMDYGYFFMEPEKGLLACGYEGKGRFPKVEEIVFYIKSYLKYKCDFLNKKILVTAGACQEAIDPMRFITNYSSGKMGLAIARAAHIRGAKVYLIYADIDIEIPYYLSDSSKKTLSAEKMYFAVTEAFANIDITFMSAAVADYKVENINKEKMKKKGDLTLKLVRTKDILAEIGKRKSESQLLIGFAAESENIKENAYKKLVKKNLNFIAANNISVSGKDNTKIHFISKETEDELNGDKFEVANSMLDIVLEKIKKMEQK